VSKNDRVPALRDEIAHTIANHLDRNEADVYPPTDDDYDLADTIIHRYINADPHGYVEFFRRLTWAVVYIILAAAVVGASIFHDTWSAK
jgi:hypothetical protein